MALVMLLLYQEIMNNNSTDTEVESTLTRGRYDGVHYVGRKMAYYKKDIPLIWIGGVPRSGTTLMCAMLDAHEDIRCGEETRVIPSILRLTKEPKFNNQSISDTANKEQSALNIATGAYILSIISKHGNPAPYLCNKDPMTLQSMPKILTMFPNSKFILMIRDGHATIHSMISRNVSIAGFDTETYQGALKDWNKLISQMYQTCLQVGGAVCLPKHYELLVLPPEVHMRHILEFLDIEWDENVLHHEQTIGKKNGISLSK